MLRLRKNAEIPREPETQARNVFVRLLTSEVVRTGVASPLMLLGEDGPSVRARYAPMQRLLTRVDEQFLRRQGCPEAAMRLRREHRRCYREFLADLRREIRQARRLRGLAMASAGSWDFWSLLAYVVLSEFSLLYLGWLGWRHSAGIATAARDVTECLNFLLADPRLPAEAT
jgi:hypothetical protein